jgi:hypothetical protein
MRVTFGSASAIALAVVLCGACSGQGGGQAQASAAPQGESITAVGCPVAGPTTGCVTIKSGGKVYDLATASPAVDLSRKVGISVTGRAAGEVTACGVKMSDVEVEYLGLECAGPPPAS